ncbi:MAG: hypothetical protein E5X35_11675 [Mesorhizobium sp.]|uniref:hypothetical protein n=1 Tax=unclassified Mesorhizobium TaxID=325217 RepID=UPI000FCC23FE|nr:MULTISPECIES: hypothetical protein [unclassified Mesorhizobium]RUV65192.1 hypothetical protein EOA85_00065 [Mesorhizobium sp. M5C.F.Ca.IN.020.29.1.1]TIM87632.1 MAG: hypothetical protein E5Y50_11390 [Mesorhizobium sp.]TIR33317.1 MAG: hypothetical protein E5X35_11675 [Mesorhizobium sp.]
MMWSYDWWREALESPHEIGRKLKIHEDEPQPGFYRKRAHKDGPWVPVAIWPTDAGMVATVANRRVDANSTWTFCCEHPVSEEIYRAVAAGGQWPDDPPAIGHNLPKSDDPHEALSAEFLAETELAVTFLRKPIQTKDDADRAAVWSKRLATIAKRATDLHKVEKQPHLDAGRAVDDKWRGLKEDADALSKKLKRHLDDFLREQDRIEQERQRKAREEADKVRREAEAAALKAAEAAAAPGVASNFAEEAAREADRLAEKAADAQRDTEARNSGAGRTGAKVSLRTFVTAEITDYDALVMALKDRPEVREVIQTLANRAAKSGVQVPGMKAVEERRAA